MIKRPTHNSWGCQRDNFGFWSLVSLKGKKRIKTFRIFFFFSSFTLLFSNVHYLCIFTIIKLHTLNNLWWNLMRICTQTQDVKTKTNFLLQELLFFFFFCSVFCWCSKNGFWFQEVNCNCFFLHLHFIRSIFNTFARSHGLMVLASVFGNIYIVWPFYDVDVDFLFFSFLLVVLVCRFNESGYDILSVEKTVRSNNVLL